MLASLSASQRQQILSQLTNREISALLYDWTGFLARPSQLPPPGNWRTWLVLAGRGFGKTRTGAEWVRSQVESGKAKRIALVARTAADVRDVLVEGESGLLSISPPWFRPHYEPSKRRLTWPSGAVATCFSADEPDLLRGPQHDAAWCDELAAWQYEETWDQLQFGLRLGDDPRCIVTTTPRPTKLIRALLANPATIVTRGSTYENKANLAPAFFSEIISKYEHTRLGRQELNAELLDDVPGALWTRSIIDQYRVQRAPSLVRVVIAIDPAVTSGENSDETGIVIAGRDGNGHGYVLDDLSCRLSPDGWARRAVNAYHERHADRLVAEINNGGDLVGRVIRTVDDSISYHAVRASRGKYTRAEPIAALYEQGKIHHVGSFPVLEDQMCSFVPDSTESPDRMDALVWALTDLFARKPFEREHIGPAGPR